MVSQASSGRSSRPNPCSCHPHSASDVGTEAERPKFVCLRHMMIGVTRLIQITQRRLATTRLKRLGQIRLIRPLVTRLGRMSRAADLVPYPPHGTVGGRDRSCLRIRTSTGECGVSDEKRRLERRHERRRRSGRSGANTGTRTLYLVEDSDMDSLFPGNPFGRARGTVRSSRSRWTMWFPLSTLPRSTWQDRRGGRGDRGASWNGKAPCP
jgi:hypothetical protein